MQLNYKNLTLCWMLAIVMQIDLYAGPIDTSDSPSEVIVIKYKPRVLNSFRNIPNNTINKKGESEHHFNGSINLIAKSIYNELPDTTIHSFYFEYPLYLLADSFKTYANSSYKIERFSYADLTILNSSYANYLEFEQTTFRGVTKIANNPDYEGGSVRCDFHNCTFLGGVCFTNGTPGSNFTTDLRFEDCTIQNGLDLSYCSFDSLSTLYIAGNTRIDYINLSYVKKIDKLIDLTSVKPLNDSTTCKINLVGCDISKVRFQYQNFTLVFPEEMITYGEDNDIVNSTYEALLANFNTNGYKESAEKLDIEYNNYKNRNIRLFNYILPYYWNCYGYHKEWIFRWTCFFLLLFTTITFIGFNGLNRSIEKNGVYFVSNIPAHHPIAFNTSLLARIWYSFLYTSNIFFHLTLKLENLNFRKLRVLYIILVYSTGIICVGYIANFVIQK